MHLREKGNDLWVFKQKEAGQVFLLRRALLGQVVVERDEMKRLESHKFLPAAHSIITSMTIADGELRKRWERDFYGKSEFLECSGQSRESSFLHRLIKLSIGIENMLADAVTGQL